MNQGEEGTGESGLPAVARCGSNEPAFALTCYGAQPSTLATLGRRLVPATGLEGLQVPTRTPKYERCLVPGAFLGSAFARILGVSFIAKLSDGVAEDYHMVPDLLKGRNRDFKKLVIR